MNASAGSGAFAEDHTDPDRNTNIVWGVFDVSTYEPVAAHAVAETQEIAWRPSWEMALASGGRGTPAADHAPFVFNSTSLEAVSVAELT